MKKLRKSYGVDKKVTFSTTILKTTPDDLRLRREHLQKEYGFSIEEQRYITRQKPNFIMYNQHANKGMESLSNLLVGKYGFSKELVRTLVLKYPKVLGQSDKHITTFFEYMKNQKGIDEMTTMKLVFEIPILLNTDIAVKSKEIEELFRVYHEITPAEVTNIFLDFPYLYCCQTVKIQRFMAEFRKYRFSKEQILDLVSL